MIDQQDFDKAVVERSISNYNLFHYVYLNTQFQLDKNVPVNLGNSLAFN